MSGKPYQEDGVFLGNEQVKMDLNGVHVIKVFTSQDGVSEARRVSWRRNENRIYCCFVRERTGFISER